MKRMHRPFLILAAFLLLLFTATIARAQAGPVTVRFTPEVAQVGQGETVAVVVEVLDVSELYGFSVAFTFDAGVLQVQDSDPALPGVQVGFGTFLEPGIVIINMVDNENGFVEFAMTQLNPSPARSGSGSLIVVNFRGEAAGEASPLEMVFVQLAAPRGVEIPAEGSSGSVEVLADPPAGPTNTPVPTQPAGTTLPSPTPPAQVTAAPTSTDQPAGTVPPQTATAAPGTPNATESPAPLPAGTDPPSPSPTSIAPAQQTGTEVAPAATATGSAEAGAAGVVELLPTAMTPPTSPTNSPDNAVAEAPSGDDGAESAAAQNAAESGSGVAPGQPSVIGEGAEGTPASAPAETESEESVPWAVALLALAGIAVVVAGVAFALRRLRQ